MNDVPSLARQARANLAQALSALQEDNVPPQTQSLASVVAEAMNLLHHIEKNHSDAQFDRSDRSTRALLLVRNALNSLQAPENSHPSLESVLEPAAHAVGLVHQLNQLATQQEATPLPSGPAPTDRASTDPAPIDPAPTAPVASQSEEKTRQQLETEALSSPAPNDSNPSTPEESAVPPPASNGVSGQPTAAHATAAQASAGQGLNNGARSAQSAAIIEPEHESFAPAAERLTSNPERISSVPERISSVPVSLPALDPLPDEVYIEVALGAYSTSNFYRHVVNADVVDDGGLFVANYTPPELTQNIRVRAIISGGFEFEARGTVEWRREMPKSGSLNPLTPPGFGVKFTEISDDARKIMHRYTRSREPFIHATDAFQSSDQ